MLQQHELVFSFYWNFSVNHILWANCFSMQLINNFFKEMYCMWKILHNILIILSKGILHRSCFKHVIDHEASPGNILLHTNLLIILFQNLCLNLCGVKSIILYLNLHFAKSDCTFSNNCTYETSIKTSSFRIFETKLMNFM